MISIRKRGLIFCICEHRQVYGRENYNLIHFSLVGESNGNHQRGVQSQGEHSIIQ